VVLIEHALALGVADQPLEKWKRQLQMKVFKIQSRRLNCGNIPVTKKRARTLYLVMGQG
jgi:hypothetical protein